VTRGSGVSRVVITTGNRAREAHVMMRHIHSEVSLQGSDGDVFADPLEASWVPCVLRDLKCHVGLQR
jgi:hypothetical protein